MCEAGLFVYIIDICYLYRQLSVIVSTGSSPDKGVLIVRLIKRLGPKQVDSQSSI